MQVGTHKSARLSCVGQTGSVLANPRLHPGPSLPCLGFEFLGTKAQQVKVWG